MSHKILKPSLLSLLGLIFSVSQVFGTITINVSTEKLKDPGGFDMAVSGIIALVADADGNGFSGPSDTSIAGDDFLVASWSLSSGVGVPGAFLGTTGPLAFSGDWGAGDELIVYFFPTLTSAVSAAAVPYGEFRAESGAADGTDPWVTPEDGTLAHDLIFATTDAETLFVGGGSTPADAGIADLVTPGTPPVAPTGVAGVAEGTSIIVSWTDVSDETGFRVERRQGANGAWEILGTTVANVSQYIDDTVGSSLEYFYRVVAIRGASFSAYSALSDAVSSSALSARFTNLSNRALVGTGDNILIGSFLLSGGPLRVFARVGGQALAGAVADPLLDPIIELRRVSDNELIASNDSWKSDQQALIESTTLAPQFDVEPALVATLTDPGFYSIIVRGVGDTTGFANVEIYEFPDETIASPGKLINLSNRAFVGVGDNILIGSLLVAGDAPQRIFARVGGPAIAGAVTDPLLDPIIELRRVSDNQLIASNDSWKSDQQALIESTTLAPQFDVEPALVATLDQPGFYSIIVRGVNDTTGFANVEIYDFPE